MAQFRNSPPPDWGGWGDDPLYFPRSDPLSGGYNPGEDYDGLTAPVPSAPPRSTTPFGQFLPSLLDAVARLPKPPPPGRFLPSIGVHLPPPQTVLATRRYDPPPPPLTPLEPAADYTTLTVPKPMVGPQSTERVAGFGVTPARVPGGLDPAQGDGLWPNAAAGFSEVVYNALGGTADDRADSINDQIDQVNFLLGRNDPYIAEDQILGSRWFATKAEDWLEVPDPARIRAVTGWEKAARVGGVAAASLVALLLATRGSGTATRTPSLPNVQPLGPGGNPPGGAPGAPSQAGRAFTGGRVAADDTARTAGGLVATTKPEQAYGGRSVDAFDSSDTSILPKPYQDAASVISTGKELPPRQVLYHYTDERGLNGITTSNYLNPSLWYAGTKDVRYGNGQYVSDIVPGTRTPEELSAAFLRSPYQGHRFTHYIEIDATDLGAINGRPGVYVIPNEKPLDLTRRILRNGRVPGK